MRILLFFIVYLRQLQEGVYLLLIPREFLIKIDVGKESIRKKINGDKITITNVPTLLLSHDDGTVQLFVGDQKILNIINKLTSPREDKVVDKKPIESYRENKSEKIVRFEDNEELEFLSEDEATYSQPTFKQKTNGQKNKSDSLKKRVEQMMAQREKTLGYSDRNNHFDKN